MTRMPACLRHAAEVGDGDAGDAVDGFDAVQLERVDDEVEAVGQFGFGSLVVGLGLSAADMGSPVLVGDVELVAVLVDVRLEAERVFAHAAFGGVGVAPARGRR